MEVMQDKRGQVGGARDETAQCKIPCAVGTDRVAYIGVSYPTYHM
jgi:hypothetical protein